jgi:hypothetical protein
MFVSLRASVIISCMLYVALSAESVIHIENNTQERITVGFFYKVIGSSTIELYTFSPINPGYAITEDFPPFKPFKQRYIMVTMYELDASGRFLSDDDYGIPVYPDFDSILYDSVCTAIKQIGITGGLLSRPQHIAIYGGAKTGGYSIEEL